MLERKTEVLDTLIYKASGEVLKVPVACIQAKDSGKPTSHPSPTDHGYLCSAVLALAPADAVVQPALDPEP